MGECELTKGQIDRIDEIHNAVFDLCKIFTEDENLEWNMSFIGEIAENVCEILVREGHSIRYPYCDEMGNVFDYYFANKPKDGKNVEA